MKKAQYIHPEQGKRLKQAIKHANTTQDALAKKVYMSPQTISKIANGKAPLTLENAHAFARCLNVRWQYLACKDGFLTDHERMQQMIGITVDIEKECVALVAALGYQIISMEQKEDGSHESIHRPYKDVRINIGASGDEILSVIDAASPVRVFRIKSPDGRIADVEHRDFLRLWQDIEDFARFRCEKQFEKYKFERYAQRKDKGF